MAKCDAAPRAITDWVPPRIMLPATRELTAEAPGFISLVALAEIIWVMTSLR